MNKEKNYNLYISFLTLLFFLVLLFGLYIFETTVVYAAKEPFVYKLLSDLPGMASGTAPTTGEYLSGMVKIVIGITTILAVLMMVIAGIEHVGGAASESARKDAKTRMWGALLGLLLALASYMILNTINPNLLSTDLSVKSLPTEEGSGEGGGGGGGGSWD